ncbi:MAG: ABC transporter substrate-binding protein [Lautropia sp.]
MRHPAHLIRSARLLLAVLAPALALTASLLPAPAAAQGTPARATTLALPATAIHFTPIYIAADAGLWSKRGLDVKLPLIAGPGATNAVIAGSADFASTAATSVLRAAARGQPMLVIATTHAEFLLEVVLSEKAARERKIDPKADLATRVRALKGATIAIDAPLGLPHGMLKYLGAKAGVDVDKELTLTPMQPPNMVASLKSGAIDGFAFSEPFVATAVDQGAVVVIRNSRDDMPEINPYASNVIVTRPDYCQKNESICRDLVAGLAEALKMMQDEPAKAREILRARFAQLPAPVLERSFELIRSTSPKDPTTDERALRNTQQFALTGGTLKPDEKRDDLASLFSNRFAK